MLDRSGGFVIGGKVIVNPANPNRTLSCDHGYVEYFIPSKPRKASLVMWHSSSTQVWQNRWDGGEGFKDMFLRRNYPVYLWDGPRVGRANWGCEAHTYTPTYLDQGNFTAWKFGPVAPAGSSADCRRMVPRREVPDHQYASLARCDPLTLSRVRHRLERPASDGCGSRRGRLRQAR